MRKLLFTTAIITIAYFVYILFTAQKSPDNGKFYYAFSEKIYLTEVPNKFLIKTISANDAETLALNLISLDARKGKGIIKQKENCLLVETDDVEKFKNIIKNAGSKILFTKPCYKYQQSEMYYADEIIVEPLRAMILVRL